jgi:hypothetical protein
VHDTHLPPTRTYFGDGKPVEYTYGKLTSRSLYGSSFAFEAESHLLLNSPVEDEAPLLDAPTKFIIWKKKSDNQIEVTSIPLNFTPNSVSLSPHGTKLAVTHNPDANGYKTEVWSVQASPQLLCTIAHPLHPKPPYGNQSDPHYRLPILWANSGEYDSSLFYAYYNQEGTKEISEKLYVWNAFTGQLTGYWNKFDTKGLKFP